MDLLSQVPVSPYSLSKAAVDKYSRDMAAELLGTNVLVNYLDPYWLITDMEWTKRRKYHRDSPSQRSRPNLT
ncbi:MAG: SDR family NAD(P)-dependent oxidoreductase [Chloroflexota bacterium]